MTGKRTFFILGTLLALSPITYAQNATVLAANYDINFAIEDQVHSVKSHALVRSGNEIPVLLQKFKVGLRVSKTSPGTFSVEIVAYERTGSTWYQITVPAPEFSGQMGVPAEYVWESGEMKIDLAIVVELARRRGGGDV